MKAIINGELIIPNSDGKLQLAENKVILFDEKIDKIISNEEFQSINKDSLEKVVDAGGKYVSPGFVNIHIHGCVGRDTMDCDLHALKEMADFQGTTGVTAFLPTTMTYDLPRIYRAMEVVKEGQKYNGGARILGANMEGPFISAKYKGAQAEESICQAEYRFIEKYKDIIKLITIAPETLPKKSDFIKKCQQAGIVVSIGHTAASYACAYEAIKKDRLTHITHLFNAMTGFHHREPGVVGAAMDTDVYCEIIVDNIHCAPAAQRIVYRLKGLERIALITDSMRACGLGDGESELGGQRVFVKNQRATLADGTIAGSILTMDRAIYNYAANLNIPVWQAVESATMTPARALGLDHIVGSLSPGKYADMVIFDERVNIAMTFRGGKVVFSRQ
ncbi:N-acetylglucosamine-6-phosphate deacetylase [Anaerovibrio sp.]|uniref:N-acetylglucosamine-6-phosphate deacetylase n=1 Tax=Anaerovibrio sp. TaxID=1872532 RepID=UPI0025BD8AB1|nr:N-acetylglucosamine-6-phosphate deacetylase [Anaerovibrio sp.]MBR2143343.1 N-acetylglucosamine-6-phosphate deacetylase [Anaerovibrio sp.]